MLMENIHSLSTYLLTVQTWNQEQIGARAFAVLIVVSHISMQFVAHNVLTLKALKV